RRQRMSVAPSATPAPDAPQGATPLLDRWEGLRMALRARVLVALIALPVGVLMRPEVERNAHDVLWGALAAVGALSAGFWLALRTRRGLQAQIYGQLCGDLALVTALSAFTGGRASQFVLFFALVVIAGGVLGRLTGGIVTAVGAGLAYVALPWISAWAT